MRVANNTEWLFFHLWKKNPETGAPCSNLNVAETIIFRWAQPYFWYYTAKDGVIVRKTKEKILLQTIEESFSNNVAKCDVVAETLTSSEDSAMKSQEKIEFEYIPKQDFHDYLFQREKSHNVIIQKFIEPKNNQNALIKVAWTPQFCLFFRKTNINDINNPKVALLNRLATFEGPEHLSHSDSISSPILASELEQTCLNIVKHINSVTSGNVQISKMVLFFKLDDKNRLWLLFCTGLKLREKVQNSANGSAFKRKIERPLSPVMMLATKKEILKPKIPVQYLLEDQINQVDDNACIRCKKEELLYDLKLKLVLDHEEKIIKGLSPQDIEQVVEEPDNDESAPFFGGLLLPEKKKANIPAVMKKLYPSLTEERYVKLKKNVSLMNMMVKVCESCYLVVTENLLENEEDKNAKKIKTQLRENIKKESDYFGFSSLSGNKKTGGTQPAQDKPTTAKNSKPAQEQESYHMGTTESDMNYYSKRNSYVQGPDDSHLADNKGTKPSNFSSYKKPQHNHAKSAAEGRRSRNLPQIGIPQANDFKLIDTELSPDFYSKIPPAQLSNRAKTNAPPLRQLRSPYATEMKPPLELRAIKTPDQGKTIMLPRALSKDKISTEASFKSSVAQWKNNKSQSSGFRTNYSSMLSTIKDLKAVLGQTMNETHDTKL